MNTEFDLLDGFEDRQIQTPIVYVREEMGWEYKLLVRRLTDEGPPSETELNELGADGWELAGVLSDSPLVYFYFKRLIG